MMATDTSKLPRIIGLSGKAKSGKDSAASIIIEHFPQYIHAASSENVRRVVAIITGTTLEFNRTEEGKMTTPKGYNVTLGRMQQLIGQGMRDIIHEDVWISSTLNDHKDDFVIITDVRYRNEVENIREAGGIVIRLQRTCELDDGRDMNHSSEIALDKYSDFDTVINNNGSKEDLERDIMAYLLLFK